MNAKVRLRSPLEARSICRRVTTSSGALRIGGLRRNARRLVDHDDVLILVDDPAPSRKSGHKRRRSIRWFEGEVPWIVLANMPSLRYHVRSRLLMPFPSAQVDLTDMTGTEDHFQAGRRHSE